jgi:hypothetical protein
MTDLAPGSEGSLLNRVLGKVGIAQDGIRKSVGVVDGWPENCLESLDLASLGTGDELLLRSGVHNLTLNTCGQRGSVSAGL